MGEYVIAHDLGTSGNKAVLYDLNGNLKGNWTEHYGTFFGKRGEAEQDAKDWWRAVCISTRKLLETAKIGADEVAAVSFSGQMMGCLLVDAAGEPLRSSIIWADTRAGRQEKRMVELAGAERGYQITGHRLSSSYSAAKLLWIKENQPEIYDRAAYMLNAKDYIVFRLTGEIRTDYSDASGTNLLDLRKKTWSDELLELFGLDKKRMPELTASSAIAGYVTKDAAAETGLLCGTPVVMGGGDGSCACVGAGVVREGRIYNVIGSSSWISSASKEPYFDEQMRTFNWIHLDETLYTPCGTMQAAGLSYQWFKEQFLQAEGVDTNNLTSEYLMRTSPGADGVLYLPYLLGERSPRWNPKARGCFIGMSMTSTKAELLRAVLEGVGYNLKIILDALPQSSQQKEITVIGGGAKNTRWLQILSDIWEKEIVVPGYLEEATSMGAAVCAGVGIGAFSDFSAIERYMKQDRRIVPCAENKEIYRKQYRLFEKSYRQLAEVFDENQ